MMRLLEKKSVSVQVAIEKKRQIDSGIKLASKVDAVRETLLEEEKRLAEFRDQSIARTQTEINAKIKEKDSILAQIKERREQLVELNKPLTIEWQKIEETEKLINEKEIVLYQKEGELDQGIALNIRRERENAEEKQRIATERQKSSKLLTEADLMREMASGILINAKSKADDITSNAQRKDEASSKREKAVEIREREVEKETIRFKKVEKEQARKDKEIKDKYETLQRDITRHDNDKRITRLK